MHAPDVLLLVIGGSRHHRRGHAEAQAARRRRARAVPRPRADPVPSVAASDMFVLPSAYEANALVVLEALACGLPVVSTRVGFAPEIIEDGRNRSCFLSLPRRSARSRVSWIRGNSALILREQYPCSTACLSVLVALCLAVLVQLSLAIRDQEILDNIPARLRQPGAVKIDEYSLEVARRPPSRSAQPAGIQGCGASSRGELRV